MAEWMLDDVNDAAPDAGERALCPDGTHAFEIKDATEGPHKWKEGEFLMLRLSDTGRRYGLVFCDIPKDKRGAALADSLAKAVGCAAFGRKVAIDPGELVGQSVLAEVYQSVSAKNGKTYVNVRKFSSLPVEAGAVETATAKPKRSAAAPAIGGDDIPF